MKCTGENTALAFGFSATILGVLGWLDHNAQNSYLKVGNFCKFFSFNSKDTEIELFFFSFQDIVPCTVENTALAFGFSATILGVLGWLDHNEQTAYLKVGSFCKFLSLNSKDTEIELFFFSFQDICHVPSRIQLWHLDFRPQFGVF